MSFMQFALWPGVPGAHPFAKTTPNGTSTKETVSPAGIFSFMQIFSLMPPAHQIVAK
jgi:hypothetical protein